MEQKWRDFFPEHRGGGGAEWCGMAGGPARICVSASVSSLRAEGAGSRGRRIINGVSCRCTISLDKPPGPCTSGTLQPPLRITSTRVPWKGTQVSSRRSGGRLRKKKGSRVSARSTHPGRNKVAPLANARLIKLWCCCFFASFPPRLQLKNAPPARPITPNMSLFFVCLTECVFRLYMCVHACVRACV